MNFYKNFDLINAYKILTEGNRHMLIIQAKRESINEKNVGKRKRPRGARNNRLILELEA